MFDPLGILIAFMQEKSRMLKDVWPGGVYFNNNDAISMMEWSKEEVLNILDSIVNLKGGNSTSFDDSDICPFCLVILYERDHDNCDECTYHSKCMYRDGEWLSFANKMKYIKSPDDELVSPIIYYLKIKSYLDIYKMIRKVSDMTISKIKHEIKKARRENGL